MCPSCGYCAPDISEQIEKAPELVKSDDYKQQLNNPYFSKLARTFICYSLIQEDAQEYAPAGWASVHAAWVCDDEANDAASKKCREKAVILFKKAKEIGQQFAQNQQAENILLADLLRRSGQFELALNTCEEGLRENPKTVILNILLGFEKELITKFDVACHKVNEGIKEEDVTALRAAEEESQRIEEPKTPASKIFCILSVLLWWCPVLGLVIAYISLVVNKENSGWRSILSIISAILSTIVTSSFFGYYASGYIIT